MSEDCVSCPGTQPEVMIYKRQGKICECKGLKSCQ